MASASAIKVLVIGGTPTLTNTIAGCLAGLADFPVVTEFEPELAAAMGRLSDSADNLLFLTDDYIGPDAGLSVRQVKDHLPSACLIVLFRDDDERRALECIGAGADDAISLNDLSARHLQKIVGRAIKRSESRWARSPDRVIEQLIDNSLDGAVAFDRHQRVIFWNPAMEKMFELSREQVLGRPMTEVLPFLQSSGEDALLRECLKGHSTVGNEQSFMRPGKKRRVYFRAVYYPVRDREGRVSAVCAIVRNMGELRIAKQQAAEAKTRFEHLADTSKELIWISKEDGERIYFNEKWLNFTGLAKEQARLNGWQALIYQEHRQLFKESFTTALATREPFHIEYRLKAADGQHRWVLDSGTPLFQSDGQFIGYFGVMNSISETRTSPQSVPSAAAAVPLNSGVLDNSPIGVWKLDLDLKITHANPAVTTSLGVPSESLVGKLFSELVPSVSPNVLVAVVARGERIHLPSRPLTMQLADDGEKIVYWDVTAWPLRNDKNQITGVCVSTMEVTERQKRTQQKDDFVATLVHDLKTPLIGADRTLDTLIKGRLGDLDSGQSEVLSMLKRSNHQLLIMIQNLIEVYKYEMEKPSLSFEPLDLDNVVDSCVKELSAWADAKGITLTGSLPEKLPEVTGDRMAVRRVILNLIDNAIKFTPKGGSISVTAEPAGSAVIINVSDTGPGMSQSDQEKLFKRFSRGEKQNGAIGTGLGLYLCAQIVKAHRGTITCHSREGVGTTFSVVLPLRPEELGSTSGMFQVVKADVDR